MTVGSFASTIIANGSWTGVAVLVPIGAALLAAAALLEIGQVLLGLADLTCAACTDPSNGMGTGPATVGAVGTGLVLGSVVGSGSGLGGGPTPPYPYPPARGWGIDPADDAGDVTPPLMPPRPPEGWISTGLGDVARQIERWTHDVIGEDEVGTVPSAGKA